MVYCDVIIAGGGVSGLLLASAFSPSISVLLLEQQGTIPTTKYWMTDGPSLHSNPDLASCVDRQYESLDFIAYDGSTARVLGEYHLWHATKLVERLLAKAQDRGTRLLTGQRLYSVTYRRDRVVVRANSEEFHAKVLIDCMGFGSPLITAKRVVDISGYYILHGCEVRLKEDLPPIGLANVLLERKPTFFELFPTSIGTAHAALILPSTSHQPTRTLKTDWNFIVSRSHYSRYLDWSPGRDSSKAYFGIIPVGRLRTRALDRILFFGEAGQANPAASATGLTRMLRTFRHFVEGVECAIQQGRFDARSLASCTPQSMSTGNRIFQECLFERILSFTSDDFRHFVEDLGRCPDDVVNDLIFANFPFSSRRALAFSARLSRRPSSPLGWALARTLTRRLLRRSV